MRLLIPIFVVMCSSVAGQQSMEYIPLKSLLADSDLVVVGSSDITIQGTHASATLRPVRTIKGDLQGASVVALAWEVSGLPEVAAHENTGIWFLQRKTDAKLAPLPLVAANVRFVGDYFLPVDPAAPPLPITGSPDERLAGEMVNAVEHNSSNLYVWNWVELTRDETDRALGQAFSALAASPQVSVKAFGISGLIRMGQDTGFRALLADNSILTGDSFPTDLVALAVCAVKPRPDLAEFLQPLTTDRTPKFKQCASEKLAALR
jgi:hypothetical protein